MKCIHCDHDSRKKDRPNRRCPGCGRPFAFEPTEGDRLTDNAFKNALDRLSGGGKLRWTEGQLYYELCRMTKRWSAGAWSVGGLVVALPAFAAGPIVGLIALGAAAVHAAVRLSSPPARSTDVIGPGYAAEMLEKWRNAHGEPAGLLPRPRREHGYRIAPVDADLGDYSFDRAVICDRAETADILLGNRFHFENNCAVLTVDGYPMRAFDTVRSMLRRNPKLAVFALHDCTPDGCRLATKLRTDDRWFRGIGTVTDVGLRPIHQRPFQRILLRASEPTTAGDGIDGDEAAWLSKFNLELAAIRSEQIIKRLFKAISLHDLQAGIGDGYGGYGGGDGGYVDVTSFGTDAEASDGGPDAFG